jgi:hypothetical protein
MRSGCSILTTNIILPMNNVRMAATMNIHLKDGIMGRGEKRSPFPDKQNKGASLITL